MFRYSSIAELTHDHVIERWHRLPRDLHTVLLGSGELALAVDGTGMQGLNSRRQQYRETASTAGSTALSIDALYLYRDEALSEHYDPARLHPLFPGGNGAFSLLPCGWLDYVLEVDEERYEAARLAEDAHDWSRTFSPRTGLLETSFNIGPLRLCITAGLAPDAVEIDFRFTGQSRDGQSHAVALTVRHHLVMREGRALATGGVHTQCDDRMAFRTWHASTATSTARLLRPIELSWALIAQQRAQYAEGADVLSARCETRADAFDLGFRIVSGSDRDGTQGLEHARARAIGFDAARGLEAIADAWRAYLAAGAELWIGDPTLEYLTANQQYVLKAGTPWHTGIPLGTLWNRAFAGATFWDSFFASDGMLRSGHLEEVRQFCDWLVRSAAPEGRPHYWMTWYDGTPCSTGDKAYQVCLAYSQVCIRLYEVTRDAADLRERVFPYLRRVAAYLLDEVLVCNDGRWQLKGEVAGDIDAPSTSAVKETGMLAWVVACVAKCGDYAREVQVDDPVVRQCQAVDAFFRAQPIDLSQPGMWGAWYGYMTGLGPHQDVESYRRYCVETQVKKRFDELALQPWPLHAIGTTYAMLGHADMALMLLPEAVSMMQGIGYSSEVPLDSSGGISCYPPSSGSWLSLLLTMCAWGSLWDDEVKAGVALPRAWRLRPIRFRDVVTLNGARVSGTVEPTVCEYIVDCRRPMRLRAVLPRRLVGEPLQVVHNGAVLAAPLCEGEHLLLPLAAGRHTISIARDCAVPTEVLVVEPFSVGCDVAGAIAAGGACVRLLREYDAAPRFMADAKLVLLHVSYVTPPDDVVDALEAAVRKGVVVLTLFHAACPVVTSELAELTGVRARITSNYWDEPSRPHTFQLTAAGRKLLPDLPETTTVPCMLDVAADLLPDVEVLAVEAGTATPALTRRRVGAGWVYWYAPGSHMMDRELGKLGWNSVRQITAVYGQDVEASWSHPHWAHSADFQATVRAIVNLHVEG